MKITTETEVFYNRMRPFVRRDELLQTGAKTLNNKGELVDFEGHLGFYKASLKGEKPAADNDKAFSISSAEKVSFMHVDDDPTEPYDRYITNTALAKTGYLATSEVVYGPGHENSPGGLKDGRSRIRMYLASIDSPNNPPWVNRY
ncbi:MAG: hypothetical protein HZB68_03490 [Candidatus Aenigmarchaeota archaeon]|nr:hypothetical protein [Candidatus Aenigmarchaeota archaeon]